MSVRPSAWKNSTPTARIFKEFVILLFFEKSVQKIQGSLQSGKNNGHLRHTSVSICVSVLLKMIHVSKKKMYRKPNTLLLSVKGGFFLNSCHLCDSV